MQPPLLSFAADAVPSEDVQPVSLDALIEGKLLVQASSGAGKSWAIRYLLEQTYGRVQHFVLDPEGEFGTLREQFPYILVGKDADVEAHPDTAGQLCRALMEAHASAIFDLYELKLKQRRQFVHEFITALMELDKAYWTPLLIIVDEAPQFAPEGSTVESTEALTMLSLQGRKRAFCPIYATQRLSKVDKNVVEPCANKLIGRTGLDLDMRRAADELGFDAKQRSTLKTLRRGQFYTYGPAISDEVILVRTGDVVTTHRKPGQVGTAPAPPAPDSLAAILEQLRSLVVPGPETEETAGKGQTPARVQIVEKIVEKEVYAFREGEIDSLRQCVENLRATSNDVIGLGKDLGQLAEHIDAALRRLQPAAEPPSDYLIPDAWDKSPITAKPESKPPRERSTPRTGNSFTLTPPQQRILDALASFEALGVHSLERSNVAVFSDQSPKSSAFNTNLRTLRNEGLIIPNQGSIIALTDAGMAIARPAPRPASLEELHRAWYGRLPAKQSAILRELILQRGRALHRSQLAHHTDQSNTSSAYDSHLRALRDLGLIYSPQPHYWVVTQLLFPEGLE